MATAGQAKRSKVQGSVVVVAEQCKGCGFCVEFCPTTALELSALYNAKGYHPPALLPDGQCTGCNICGLVCPDFAIHGFVHTKPKEMSHAG